MAKLFDFTIKNGAAGGFGMFSAAHFAWLAALLAAGGGVCLAYKKADENSRRVIRRAAAWGALGMELLRAALLFAALGYYPILKARFDAVRPGLLSRLCKLAFFNAAVLAAYAVLLFVLVSDTARAEFREMGKAMTAALLLGGNIVFLLYDFVLRRLRPLYVGRLQPVLRRLFR